MHWSIRYCYLTYEFKLSLNSFLFRLTRVDMHKYHLAKPKTFCGGSLQIAVQFCTRSFIPAVKLHLPSSSRWFLKRPKWNDYVKVESSVWKEQSIQTQQKLRKAPICLLCIDHRPTVGALRVLDVNKWMNKSQQVRQSNFWTLK